MAMRSDKCNEYPVYNDQSPCIDWSGLDANAAENFLEGKYMCRRSAEFEWIFIIFVLSVIFILSMWL